MSYFQPPQTLAPLTDCRSLSRSTLLTSRSRFSLSSLSISNRALSRRAFSVVLCL